MSASRFPGTNWMLQLEKLYGRISREAKVRAQL